MATGGDDLIFEKLKEYCGCTDKAKSKDIATCMAEACAKRGKGKALDKQTVSQVCDNSAAASFGKGMTFSLTKATCKEFEKQFAKKRLERAGGKPSDADVDAEIAKMREALAQCKKVGPKTNFSKTGGVDKMTDSSQYTGAHKSRFDEDGKGKGVAGREERAENTGYVGAYKGEGTHGK
ncbi:tubulin polymerization-promoting protein family member 2-like isoform X2 [Lineus longissimus]|uniref:tubulin polymerization-promoting protein family member 2-like isoform X2 n=1 Tax=Lineus longissimus TaxID=88925 RepID=UPI00315D94EA